LGRGRGDCIEAGEVEEAMVADGGSSSDHVVICVGDVTMPLARIEVGVVITVF
jgi:hypothetical protein